MLHTVETLVGGKKLSIETGRMAKQADGSVFVQYEGVAVLVTATSKKKAIDGGDFLPLTVNYTEKAYAAGKIPGGFFKREGRPADRETLISRLIDRPVRPLFPDGFFHETQVCCTVLSADVVNDPDVIAITGASAALSVSGIPVTDFFAGVRVGLVDGEFVVNPDYEQMACGALNIVVAGTSESVTMVEGAVQEQPENVVLDAINFGHEEIKKIIPVLKELSEKVNKPGMTWSAPDVDEESAEWVSGKVTSQIKEAITIKEKQERNDAISKIESDALEGYLAEKGLDELSDVVTRTIKQTVHDIEKNVMRGSIIDSGKRIDGRTCSDIRPISCDVGILSRAHGSGLFTRGETQALVSATLGTSADAQRTDTLEGENTKSFMLHYNFPPYCVGEVGFLRSPGRREIGHGNLAERALLPVIPSDEDFPYTIRIVSEILESNGSSSMASVCGGSLALMDAGVPIKEPVAGIAMGLIKEGDSVVILSDILGAEDHLGDMDFKVTGTRGGITAIQMDIKISGVTNEIMKTALEQALQGRLHILDKINEGLSAPRDDVNEFAPRITTMYVKSDKIRDVIGQGGKTIRGIIEKTGVKIDIDDTGKVTLAAADQLAAKEAIEIIESIVRDPEVGCIYTGPVKRIMDFGAIIEIMPGTTGLLHISQIEDRRIDRVEDILSVGDEVTVKCTDIDRGGKIRLTKKGI